MYEHIINEEIIAVHQLCKLVLIHYAFLLVDRTTLIDDKVEETEKSRLLKLHELHATLYKIYLTLCLLNQTIKYIS